MESKIRNCTKERYSKCFCLHVLANIFFVIYKANTDITLLLLTL